MLRVSSAKCNFKNRSVWSDYELQRIKAVSEIKLQADAERFGVDRQQLERENEQRKQFLQKIDQTKCHKLTSKTKEDDDTKKVLDRVNIAKYENVGEFYCKHIIINCCSKFQFRIYR